jgi:transcriptional regulator with XRE-family HTH domain
MKDRIKALLINGLKASEIVDIVGCTPSYISQLMKDETFIQEVTAGRLAIQETATEEQHLGVRYQGLEHKIITSIEASLAEASLGEKVRALETIHKRDELHYRRKVPLPGAPQQLTQINVVSLNLPSHLAIPLQATVSMNETKEIIAIDGKPLAPMSSDGVKNLFNQLANKEVSDAVVAEL